MFNFRDHEGKEASVVLGRIVGLNILSPEDKPPAGTACSIVIDSISGIYSVFAGEPFEAITRRYWEAINAPWDFDRPEMPAKPS
jgi:hypothetical protein